MVNGKPKIFDVSYYQTYTIFSSPPILRFYINKLNGDKLDLVWDKLREITSYYSPKLAYNDLMVISRNKREYRVNLYLPTKRILLNYNNIKSGLKRWLSKNALALPARITTIFLLPEGLLNDYARVMDKIKEDIGMLNEELKEYYNTDKFKDLIQTINKIKDSTRPTAYDRMYIPPPRVSLYKVTYNVIPGSPIEKYIRESLANEVQGFLINAIKANMNVKDMSLFRRKVIQQVEKMESLGFTGIKDDVEKVLNTKDIDVLKRTIGEIVNRWI